MLMVVALVLPPINHKPSGFLRTVPRRRNESVPG
jgi:hypothetical protein